MFKKIILVPLILIWLVILLIFGAVAFVTTPDYLTPQVEALLQQHTKSKVSIKSVDLSLFSRFPNITLRIDSLQIKQTKDSISDLLFAKELSLSVDPGALLNDELLVRHAAIRNASIYLYVDSLNSPLKTFILPEEKEIQPADTLNSFDLSRYSLSLHKLEIDSTQIVIDDRIKRFYTRIENYNLDTSMDVSAMKTDLDVTTNCSNIIVWRDGDLLVRRTSLEFRSKMVHDRETHILSYDNARIKLNGIDLKSDGRFIRDTMPGAVNIDIKASLNTPSLSEFLALVPSSVFETKDKIETEGEVALDITYKGLYSSTSSPTIAANLKINNAKAKYESRRLALERVDCDAYLFFDPNDPQSAYADVRNLHINTSDIIDLNLSGKVKNAVEDADVDLKLNSQLNFSRFSEIFPLKEAITCRGENTTLLTAKFKLSDLKEQKYSKIFINGESTFNGLKISLDASKFQQDTTTLSYLNIEADKGNISLGDRILAASNSRTLRAQANFSNLNYRSKLGEFASVQDINVIMGANFDRQTSKINGLGVSCTAKNCDVGIDSLFSANISSSNATYIIRLKNETRETQIDAKISSKEIHITEPLYNSDLTLSTANVGLALERESPKKWKMEGNVAFTNFGMDSNIFPLPVSISQSSITVNNSGIALNNAHMKVGDTDIVATGRISNLIKKLFSNSKEIISGELKIDAPTLDIGELVDASNRSVLMAEAADEESEATPTKESSQPIAKADSLSHHAADSTHLFLVPRRVDFVFDLNVDKAQIWDAAVENLRGRATIRKGTLKLDSLRLNAIGAEAMADVVYRNISKKSANVSAEVALKRVDINRIGELFPTVKTMLPMLESFEGIVDYDLKINTNMKGNSEVDYKTLFSAMQFKGQNLVLLDSETFTDLSKTLRFKNRDRNLIESLELYALIAETKMYVLPFSLTIDRYTTYINGTQEINPDTFDINYDYHVSIIKSPLPFKAGVNITGNLDDYKFNICKAKLKKTNFDEQRKFYEDYKKVINNSEDALEESLAKKRSEMRAKREAQRKSQEKSESKAQSAEDEPTEKIDESVHVRSKKSSAK